MSCASARSEGAKGQSRHNLGASFSSRWRLHCDTLITQKFVNNYGECEWESCSCCSSSSGSGRAGGVVSGPMSGARGLRDCKSNCVLAEVSYHDLLAMPCYFFLVTAQHGHTRLLRAASDNESWLPCCLCKDLALASCQQWWKCRRHYGSIEILYLCLPCAHALIIPNYLHNGLSPAPHHIACWMIPMSLLLCICMRMRDEYRPSTGQQQQWHNLNFRSTLSHMHDSASHLHTCRINCHPNSAQSTIYWLQFYLCSDHLQYRFKVQGQLWVCSLLSVISQQFMFERILRSFRALAVVQMLS